MTSNVVNVAKNKKWGTYKKTMQMSHVIHGTGKCWLLHRPNLLAYILTGIYFPLYVTKHNNYCYKHYQVCLCNLKMMQNSQLILFKLQSKYMKVTISKNTDTSLQEAQDIIQNTIRKLTNAYIVYCIITYIYCIRYIQELHAWFEMFMYCD